MPMPFEGGGAPKKGGYKCIPKKRGRFCLAKVKATRPEDDTNEMEFFMGVDVSSRGRDFAPEEM